jgi:hypothetical protein
MAAAKGYEWRRPVEPVVESQVSRSALGPPDVVGGGDNSSSDWQTASAEFDRAFDDWSNE